MKKNLLFFSAFLLLGFLFFTFLVSFNFFNGLDRVTTEILQRYIPRFFDTPFSLFSLVGSFEIVSLIIFILWAKSRKLKYFYVLIFYGFFHVVELLSKLFINHPSPPADLARYIIPFSFPTSGVDTGFSFPSGHMGRTMFISVIFIFLIYSSKRFSKFQKKLFYLLVFLLALIMFISRVYLGEHWFSDVIGGGLLGGIFGILSLLVL